ncbi:DUF6086 family protein [Actinocorallia libanotica]|uniref:Uncharacterized protein n=1 Tax=Actinocorallia libanotica TaxID=46162 RepID=A0ABN1RUK7_9ACTN
MSVYFEHQGRTLWNPATGLGRWYAALADAAADIVQTPTGLTENDDDTYTVDLIAFRTFAEKLYARFFRTRNPLVHALVEPSLLISLVMLERGGITMTPATEHETRFLDKIPEYSRLMAG